MLLVRRHSCKHIPPHEYLEKVSKRNMGRLAQMETYSFEYKFIAEIH